jgi:hypothetical protein
MLPQDNSPPVVNGDLYLIEVRPIGSDKWVFTQGYRDPMDSVSAARVVAELNALSKRCVYRSALVSYG